MLAMASLGAVADETKGIVVTMKDGNSVSVELSQLRSIKFDGEQMVINKVDGQKQTVALSDVKVLEFKSIVTAIQTVVGQGSDGQITVTDLSGKKVYSGKASGFGTDSKLKGYYIINANGKSHKVLIK